MPGPSGPLAAYEHWIRGQALVRMARPEDAARELEQAKIADPESVQLALAQARIATGDPRGITDLRGLVGHPALGPAARMALGDAVPAEAPTLWMAVWIDARPGGADAEAARRLAASGHTIPSLGSLDGRKQAFQRYERLADRGRVDEAVALLGAIRAAGGQFDAVTWARANLAARLYAASLDGWREALGPPESATGAPKDLFDYALTMARSGDYDTAGGIYRRVIAQHPLTDQADFASFKLGYMEYDRGRCEAAEPLLLAHAAERPKSSRAAEALWFAARCAWRSKRVDDATARWTKLTVQFPKSDLVPGAAYWLARAADDREGLARVLARWPETGWGWFAAERLGRTYPVREAGKAPPFPSALAARPEIVRARALLAQGFPIWARAELASVDAVDRAGALALGHARLAAGDYRGAQAVARPWCGEGSTDAVVRELCIPRPERALVQPIAVQARLHPLLPYAIMTAESNLDPTVTSAAGARGLMQLMPSLGAELHPQLFPDRPYNPDDLYRGPYNASLGTTELSRLLTRVGGKLVSNGMPAVIAGYNGGSDAVLRWVGEDQRPFDEFAEDIGYAETRTYVRRVLGFLQKYRAAWGDPVTP